MKSFDGKVAAITGAGSGIGRSLAIQLAEQGCHLALSDINAKGLKETVKLLSEHDVTVTSQVLDVTDKTALYSWADKVVADHQQVNIIFNNAGVALSCAADGGEDADIEWLMSINFWGVVHGTRAFLPYLKESGDGHVVNISSLFGLLGVPSQSAYNASKFAVRGYTESLRQELDLQNVNVSATSVHPGGIKTNIARAARLDDSVNALNIGVQDASSMERLFKTTAEQAAKVILNGVKKNKRRVLVGTDAKVMDVAVRLFPASYQKILVKLSQLM